MMDFLIPPVGLDQPAERLDGQRALDNCGTERGDQGIGRGPGGLEGALEIMLEVVEQTKPVTGSLVSSVVDEAREAVDRKQVTAHAGRKQSVGDWEVLRGRLGHYRGRVRRGRPPAGTRRCSHRCHVARVSATHRPSAIKGKISRYR